MLINIAMVVDRLALGWLIPFFLWYFLDCHLANKFSLVFGIWYFLDCHLANKFSLVFS